MFIFHCQEHIMSTYMYMYVDRPTCLQKAMCRPIVCIYTYLYLFAPNRSRHKGLRQNAGAKTPCSVHLISIDLSVSSSDCLLVMGGSFFAYQQTYSMCLCFRQVSNNLNCEKSICLS